ncbi:MAG: HD domain-containing protein [Defluviitaleaceae bacterium]|nr:HD domain-containing protein [Defluviitaleaceae bacterium]
MSLHKLAEAMMIHFNDTRYSEHSLKAYAYAGLIGCGENLCGDELQILSAAALLHDVGIPRALEIFGSAEAKYQEAEGAKIAPALLCKAGFAGDDVDKIAWLVANHHNESLAPGDALLQILIEADHLVNLSEGKQPTEKIFGVKDGFFKTETGKNLISALFGL